MFDQYLEQLASSDSSQRRQAIIGLGKSGDQRALSPLASIYKNDPDPSLRELALKAGRYLKGLTASVPSSEPAYAPAIVADAIVPQAEVIKAAPKEISYSARQKAKGRVDYAIGLVAEGRNDKALTELVDAIRINPELVDDQLVINLASTVTGKYSTEEAMAALVEQAQALSNPKRKGTANDKSAGDGSVAGTDNGSIIFLISILILFILTAVMTIVTRLAVINEFQLLKETVTMNARQAASFDQASASLTTLNSGNLVVGGILSTFGTLIYTAVLFGVGKLFGGTASAVQAFNRLLRVQIIMYFPVFALFGYWFFYVFSSIKPTRSMAASVGDALIGVGISFLVVYFVEFVWEGIALAKSNEFSVTRGCLSVFIGMIVFVVLAFVFLFVLGILIAPAATH